MLVALIQIINILLNIIWWIIIIQAILSWLIVFNVINTYNDFVRNVLIELDRITAPIYRPIRRIMPDLGALDLSPLVVLLAIYFIQKVILLQLYSAVASSMAALVDMMARRLCCCLALRHVTRSN